MKKFAQMYNDKIHYIYEVDEKPIFSEDVLLIEVTNRPNIKIGMLYDKTTDSFKEKTLSEFEVMMMLSPSYEKIIKASVMVDVINLITKKNGGM